MVFQAITRWQDLRDLRVTGSAQQQVAEEYLASVEHCGVDGHALQQETEFYVFQYLDHAREEGSSYSPQMVCDPFTQPPPRKANRYGRLWIHSDSTTSIAIDRESFNDPFNAFLLTTGDHDVSIRLVIGITCDNNNNAIPVKAGKLTEFSCKLR